MKTKNCIRCGIEKPLERFVKDSRKEDGVRDYCLECDRLRRGGKPKRVVKNGYKVCARCDLELPLKSFNFRMSNGVKKPFAYCKECEREYNNNRFSRHCNDCGKIYKSGSNNSKQCIDCHRKKLGEIGKKNLDKMNKNQFGKDNHMFGIQRFGIKNPNYKPEKTPEEREKGRLFEGYGIWRKSVYERDNYVCQCCGYDKGGVLNAHHIESWSSAKHKRLDVQNGITLCHDCHKGFHNTYGYGNNTEKEFNEFLNHHANTEITS